MDKKLAFITGGCKGIGAAITIKLKSLGYDVVSTSFSCSETSRKFADEHKINIIKWDVTDRSVAEKNAQYILENYGTPSVIIHNAGITKDSFFHKMNYENWLDVINTNLVSAYSTINPFIALMREQKYGRIVVLSSVNALKGQIGQANYCASKAGLIGFIKALALENANKNITANAIAPGYTETDMVKKIAPEVLEQIKGQIPAGRMAQPEEIAHAVAFLCDEMSGYINGETLNINGGLHLS